jgi:hypothetical protein
VRHRRRGPRARSTGTISLPSLEMTTQPIYNV